MDWDARLEKLRSEREALREQLAVAQARLQEIETFFALMEKFIQGSNELPASGPVAHALPLTVASIRERIYDIVADALSDGRGRPTRDLLEELNRRGVNTRNWANEIGSLSAYLSRAKDRFASRPERGGWVLVNFPKQMSPAGADTPTGLGSSAGSSDRLRSASYVR
jgi:hypothetical protein